MPTLAEIRVGYCLWVEHYGRHPGVVWRVSEGAVHVLTGTSTARLHLDHVCVLHTSAAGSAWPLSNPTYFYGSGLAVITKASAIKTVCRRCPMTQFRALEDLALRTVASAPKT